ncbi:N19M, NADH-ubiquinone oxidoreductase 9.5 kDa subunit [Serpula lacrymans var. lacrymans S7.3]|uniref:N19M, NADH-ubiquinone oxidoreductase 9.5 kDa subunit n=2 Tax=Serpula lacrymans var. lacrymans TaxID=341189 RepID=F8PWQ9_SERL3|nr:N19M, NADH-ubiquinone oxidoreductase 9.5 kDa subunit [Serpula lacrymans var. lacrymans S7.9]EGN99236.1 N19M, NADH-ubiquinone oxidoreductase 9.5 kDa subunit [Serpula lacrymans var. lacrymans S7.3]EGO24803.1 N19M, NADH-ubiquinone oxidoreductase 9.5 kDa subunit [Serpula lacrymans var. lacrymans S7.9]
MASIVSPFRRGYRYLQHLAHEQPVIFYSCVLGVTGPVLALSVPPIRRRYFGWAPGEPVPTSYPVPKRSRRAVQGYEDDV